MEAPLIGLTGRRWPATRLGAFVPVAMSALQFDLHFSDYPASVTAAGGLPFELTRDADVEGVARHLDGLILSGGADIDPAHYGDDPSEDLGELERDRDEWEFALLEAARSRGVPVLAICRGFQVVNVAQGGTLRQHVELSDGVGHPQWNVDGRTRTHGISVSDGSLLRGLVGASITVNSLHHQVIERVGEGLTVTARADDGVVEGFETADGLVIGVQWHPELLKKPDPTFVWLVERAREHLASR